MTKKTKAETLEWVTIRRRPSRELGALTDVTVTVRRANVTARWCTRTQSSDVRAAVREARAGAEKALGQALEVVT